MVLDEACRCDYGYSDTWQSVAKSNKLKVVLDEITEAVFNVTGGEFPNSCNLNFYPQGGGVGFHADDEFLFDGLNRETRIVSLSLAGTDGGGSRKFQVKQKEDMAEAADTQDAFARGRHGPTEIVLWHGDLLTMEGMFQRHWCHSVWPGDSKEYVNDHPFTKGERINLTWRTIVKHLDGSRPCRGKICPLAKSAIIKHERGGRRDD